MGVFTDRLKKLISWRREKNNQHQSTDIILLTTLILVLGCFFWLRSGEAFPRLYIQIHKESVISLEQAGFLSDLPNQLLRNDPWKEKRKDISNCGLKNKIGNLEKQQLEEELYQLVGNYPIREMVPFISEYDRVIAGLLVGIAKKESGWGEHTPSKDGQNCYNYWGYKGSGSRGTALGYGCFASPKEGVEAVAQRLQFFVSRKLNTPEKMVIWKCGASCAGHDPGSVKKWISDVSGYYNQIAYK
ncbi:MAG: hypothetical protein NT136_02480 [Candidatus Moranbacteria bacterium]|nr:hypothetical protein [Candidatus Moranbacteria bacterium]